MSTVLSQTVQSPKKTRTVTERDSLRSDQSTGSATSHLPPVRFLEKQYDLVIIGNGPHGNILASTLRKKGLPSDKLAILDPYGPLELWTRLNTNGGWSRNAEEVSRETDSSQSTEQYRTLSKIPLPITNRNLFEFLEGLRDDIRRLAIPHIKAKATTLRRTDEGYAVEVRDGAPVHAKNVVLAIGNYTEPIWPEWAKQLKTEDGTASIQHIFDQDFSLDDFKAEWITKPGKDVVIVGGGPAAINLALILSHSKPGKVTLLMRHPMRGTGVSLVDPCHLPEAFEANHCYKTFQQLPSSKARRKYIEEHRPIGSVGKSIDFMAALEKALATGQLKVIQGETESATSSDEGIQLKLKPKELSPFKTLVEEEGIDFVPYLSEPTGKVLIDTSVTDLDRPIRFAEVPIKITSGGKVTIDPEAVVNQDLCVLKPPITITSGGKVMIDPEAIVDRDLGGLEPPSEPTVVSSGSDLSSKLSTSTVLLATGFANRRPGGEFLDRMISDLDLPTYPDGYPKLNEYLEWQSAPRLHSMGRLADHQVGPYSWNVAGGIFATKRILDAPHIKLALTPPLLEYRPMSSVDSHTSMPLPYTSDEESLSGQSQTAKVKSKSLSKQTFLSMLPSLRGLFLRSLSLLPDPGLQTPQLVNTGTSLTDLDRLPLYSTDGFTLPSLSHLITDTSMSEDVRRSSVLQPLLDDKAVLESNPFQVGTDYLTGLGNLPPYSTDGFTLPSLSHLITDTSTSEDMRRSSVLQPLLDDKETPENNPFKTGTDHL